MMTSAVRAEIVARKDLLYSEAWSERSAPCPNPATMNSRPMPETRGSRIVPAARAGGPLDLGRHILAKAFAAAPAEYKQIADELAKNGVLSKEEGRILTEMAGYRNRMVHFYHEIGERELYNICRTGLSISKGWFDTFARWLRDHPEKVTGP